MGQTALIFPGQGSQQVGMGGDLFAAYPQVREIYQQADEALGFALSDLCFSGPEEALNDTAITQPALFVTCLATLRALEAEVGLPRTAMVAGHSLGELTALTAAGAMKLADGLSLVRERGRLMKLAGERRPGGMAAVLKMDDAEVESACREASSELRSPVGVANYNAQGQVVISGERAALQRAIELLRERGAKRIVPLAVSIAAHSELMESVMGEYRDAVDATPLRVPDVPVVGNTIARPLVSVREIRDELSSQLIRPVRWVSSVQTMFGRGVSNFLEVGPGDVLCKLVQRIIPAALAKSVGNLASLRALARQVGADAV